MFLCLSLRFHCAHSRHLLQSAIKFDAAGADGVPSKTALGMVSPQQEYVGFHEPLECDGPVEVWMNKIMQWMRLSLKVRGNTGPLF
eukprot:SAG22_NODE_38_length_26325_cov_107.302067_19_plen_86_part_00